jgi:hypothetical protein
MSHAMGWFAVALLALFFIATGFYMTLSPEAYLRRAKGRNNGEGSSRAELRRTRIRGAIFLAVIMWAVYGTFLRYI